MHPFEASTEDGVVEVRVPLPESGERKAVEIKPKAARSANDAGSN